MLAGAALYLLSGSSASRAQEPPAAPREPAGKAVVSFSREIRPLLAKRCFTCHGPDEATREAELRLDQRASAVAARDGQPAIVPGKPAESALLARVTTSDPDLRMPPADAGPPLTAAEVQRLSEWIAGGAEYQPHWAFSPPKRPPLPEVRRRDWVRNPIDHFVLARIEAAGLEPAPAADRYRLIRRVSLDLTGLPPTPEEADAFVNDTRPGAWERLVDRLLASPAYGERWARRWLDLARYADTNGYEKDRPRSVWPYRDWVISALNRDLPFDQFSIAQLAGDMLPDAGLSQRVATGFHRNTMLNEEGGIDPLEYRYYAMVDRVATTGSVWLGLTVGCAQCHTHKYDPITNREYYRLLALLNNADEPEIAVPVPELAARREQLQQRISQLEAELPAKFPAATRHDGGAPAAAPAADDAPPSGPPSPAGPAARFEHALQKWIDEQARRAASWHVVRPQRLEANLPRLVLQDDGSILSTGDITKRDEFKLEFDLGEALPQDSHADGEAARITGLRLEALPDPRLPEGGPGRAYYEGRKGDFFLSELAASVGDDPRRFRHASHSYGKISIGSGTADAANVIDGEGSTGWSTAGREGQAHQLVLEFAEPLEPRGRLRIRMLFDRHFAASLGRFRIALTTAPEPRAKPYPAAVEAALAAPRDQWNASQQAAVRRAFAEWAPELEEPRKELARLRAQLPSLPTTPVMQERPADHPRPTFVHLRGEYLQTGERVEPGVPNALHRGQSPPPTNRLELAQWLVSDSNPLVARVTVNRAWQAFFGQGIVRTLGDLGTQAEPPTHPLLLDWLAVEWQEQGWSLKALHRLLVTSATYRQAAAVPAEAWQRDPENRWLARGPRFRVEAEVVRDIALRASGQLTRQIGGPSVYPPQPASVTALAYGNSAWPVSAGADRYRRSLYTFSKRTAPFAATQTFNAPTGESCVVRRDRSNTPLQALTLLNDPMFVEYAVALADRTLAAADAPRQRAQWMFRRCLTRPPTPAELDEMLAFVQRQQERLEAGELDAQAVVSPLPTAAGPAAANPRQEAADGRARARAAWSMLARVLLNLDETITRP